MRLALALLGATVLAAAWRPVPTRPTDPYEIRPTPVRTPSMPFPPYPPDHTPIATPRPTRPATEGATRG